MYSVPMAIIDYIPVCLFAAAVYFMQKNLYHQMSKGAFAFFCAGTIDVFMAGFLKATYKLLYALNICDFEPLSSMFFPVQALGFLMCGYSIICLLVFKQGETKLAAIAAPAAFKGTMIFVSLMIAGVIGFDCGMAVIAAKMKKPLASILFVVACVLALMMGYLSSKNFDNSLLNWMAEIVNILGQLALLVANLILDKAGLNKFEIAKK